MIEPAVKIRDLTKSFGDVRAVDALSLDVKPGELFGLVGPDGAGKTTALRLLASVMDPTSGDAWVAGYHVVKQAEAVKEHIGYMSQRFGLYQDLTVLENIDFYADIYGASRGERRERVDRLLEFSRLGPFGKWLAGNLSGGMKQKLGLVCALVHRPRVLFLDEPTNGVDPVSRRDFWRILYQLLREDVTLVVSTSYLDEAERFSRLALMHKGKMIASGAPSEVKKLMRRSILEIRSSAPRRAGAALRGHMKTGSVSLFGDRIHVMTASPAAAEKEARDILTAQGIGVTGVRDVEPSLEDVFISVLSEQKAKP